MSSGSGYGLGVQPSNVLGLPRALGTRSATALPRLKISMVSPLSSHLERRAKSFRKSRTLAVFMVIHLYHERKMSSGMMQGQFTLSPAARARRGRFLRAD